MTAAGRIADRMDDALRQAPSRLAAGVAALVAAHELVEDNAVDEERKKNGRFVPEKAI